ncbi:hypothetical protein SAMN05421827_12631 [Pedobacter terrae]|uniref:Uncharacterized protein n=1 Tax=Pedobacter terrae TaxID=405671 RepID=A0A1G8CTX2_9SPHI|nr:hypothetical protein SAMN05421827_12631 [Pedobacter terrae]
MKQTIKAQGNIATQIKRQISNLIMCDQKVTENNIRLL